MNYFIIEKEVEENLLISDFRFIPMEDGSQYPLRQFRITWNTLDSLVDQYGLTLEWFVELALMDQAESGRDFETAFSNVVGYVQKKYREHFG